MTTRSRPRFFVTLLAVTVLACSIPFLSGTLFAADTSVRMSVEYFQQDSARVIARWAPGVDAKGPTDSYSVRWTSGNALRAMTKAAAIDTFKVQRPAFNDSALVTIAVVGIRRGVPSADTVRASLWVKNPDSRPPGVDSLKVDTLLQVARVDSMRMDFYTNRGAFLGTSHDLAQVTMAEGDSVRIVARVFMKHNQLRRTTDVTDWDTVREDDTSPVLRLAITGAGWARDTAWLHALDCRCRESGSTTNPPRLNLRSASYVVKDAHGGWRAVTPLPADPWRGQD